MGQGLCSKPVAGAGGTPSPSQGAWASSATPEIEQRSAQRSSCSLAVQMGRLAGREALPPRQRCPHLLPHHMSALEPSLKSQPPLEDTAFSGGCGDKSNGCSVWGWGGGTLVTRRNGGGGPRGETDLRVLVLLGICSVALEEPLVLSEPQSPCL